jgi:hypothetical protein
MVLLPFTILLIEVKCMPTESAITPMEAMLLNRSPVVLFRVVVFPTALPINAWISA